MDWWPLLIFFGIFLLVPLVLLAAMTGAWLESRAGRSSNTPRGFEVISIADSGKERD